MSSEQLTESISSIQRLRTSVNALLESTYRRKPDRTQIQKMHRDMKLSMRDCSYISLINLPPTVVNFWDTSMLAVEVDDGLQLYKSLNFLDQVREKSSLFSSLLIDNSLERKHPKAGHDVEMPLSVFDPVIISFNRNYPLLNVSRLSTTLLHVSVRHVLNTSLTIINMKLECLLLLLILIYLNPATKSFKWYKTKPKVLCFTLALQISQCKRLRISLLGLLVTALFSLPNVEGVDYIWRIFCHQLAENSKISWSTISNVRINWNFLLNMLNKTKCNLFDKMEKLKQQFKFRSILLIIQFCFTSDDVY